MTVNDISENFHSNQSLPRHIFLRRTVLPFVCHVINDGKKRHDYVRGRSGRGGTGQGSAGQDRAGQHRAGQGRAGQGRAGQGRAGQGRAGQGRARQGKARQDKTRQGGAGQGKAGRGGTRQDGAGRPSHLLFSTATPAVLRADDIGATKLHWRAWASHRSTVFM